MTTLAQDNARDFELGDVNELPVIAADIIYEGAAVGDNGAGYMRPLVAGDQFRGFAESKADNSAGSAGDKNVRLKTKGKVKLTISGVAITDVGKPVYASDDNTFTLTRGSSSLVGKVYRYVTTNTAIVEFNTEKAVEPYVVEVDCETDSASVELIPAHQNPDGLIIIAAFGVVTEQFGGGTEDQGVVTISDESDNAICTLTASDGGADAVNDVIEGFFLHEAATGDAGKVVAAGEYVDCACTQNTSGTSAAGKMTVHLIVKPLI